MPVNSRLTSAIATQLTLSNTAIQGLALQRSSGTRSSRYIATRAHAIGASTDAPKATSIARSTSLCGLANLNEITQSAVNHIGGITAAATKQASDNLLNRLFGTA
jgi:hypothetical protein